MAGFETQGSSLNNRHSSHVMLCYVMLVGSNSSYQVYECYFSASSSVCHQDKRWQQPKDCTSTLKIILIKPYEPNMSINIYTSTGN